MVAHSARRKRDKEILGILCYTKVIPLSSLGLLHTFMGISVNKVDGM